MTCYKTDCKNFLRSTYNGCKLFPFDKKCHENNFKCYKSKEEEKNNEKQQKSL